MTSYKVFSPRFEDKVSFDSPSFEQETQVNRPQSSHRLSATSTPSSNVPIRHASSRHHSHSVSLGAVNPSHRITRRKSMNASAVNNITAIAAALKDVDEKGSASSKRTSLNTKTAANNRGLEFSRYGSSSNNRYSLGGLTGNNDKANEEAMDDEEFVADDDFLRTENANTGSKARVRRASEGSYLTKGESKRSSSDLRCEKCGKGYKHSSCLTKHLSVLSGLPVNQLFAFTLLPCALVSLAMSTFLGILFSPMSKSSLVDVFYLQVGAYSGVDLHIKASYIQTSASPVASSSLGTGWNEPRCNSSRRLHEAIRE